MSLQPNSVLTAEPIISTAGRLDNSRVDSWYDYFYEPIAYTNGVDHSQIDSWYDYFNEPIYYASTELTQEHGLTPTSFASSNPEAQSTELTENYVLVANNVNTGSPLLGSTPLTEDYNLFAANLLTPTPNIGSGSLTQAHSISVLAVVSGQVAISTTGLIQVHAFQANDLASAQPTVSSPELLLETELETSGITTGQPVVSAVQMQEAENFSVDSLAAGTPDVGTASLEQVYALNPDDTLTPFPDVGEPIDPNKVIQQEIKEIEQMFGGWPRRAYEVPDGRLVQGEREIEATFGDRVSVDRKAKSLIKFGKSADLVADTLETVWTVGGHETYVTDNTIEYISSSSAADTQTIRIECHTVSGTGTDTKFTFLVQEVTLNGQNPVALDTPVARVSHAYNANGTELVGRVTVYENTTVVGGVPSDETKIHIDIPQGLQGSLKGATTFSDSDYYILTGGFGSVSKKQEAAVDFYLEVRTAGGVFIQQAAISATTGGPWDIDLDPAVIIPKNADVRITAESGTNNAHVFGVFKGYLAKVLN